VRMKMQGALEVGQDLLHGHGRIAIPDYIGVREAQFTAGVGILQFANHNAKIQGKELQPAVEFEATEQQTNRKKKKQSHEPEQKSKKKKQSGIANLFKYFFD